MRQDGHANRNTRYTVKVNAPGVLPFYRHKTTPQGVYYVARACSEIMCRTFSPPISNTKIQNQ